MTTTRFMQPETKALRLRLAEPAEAGPPPHPATGGAGQPPQESSPTAAGGIRAPALSPAPRVVIARIPTPLGPFGAALTPHGLARLTFPDEPVDACRAWARRWFPDAELVDSSPALEDLARQLDAYFAGRLRAFSVPLDLRGTLFQVRVWQAVAAIPHGQTRSYAGIAEAIGSPRAVRAVGLANGANPVPIVVPCHRVVGSNGALTGYAGGLTLKQRLLSLEGAAGFTAAAHQQASLPL